MSDLRLNLSKGKDILKYNKKAIIGFIILFVYILMAIFGRYLVPISLESSFSERYLAPSLKHPFGTDYFGIDIFAQIINGARTVIGLSMTSSFFAVIIGTVFGILRGYLSGKIGKFADAIISIFLVIPSFPALLIMAAIFADSNLNTIQIAFIVALWLWAPLAKQVSAQVMALKNKEFIEASRMLNMPLYYIIFRDIFPLVAPYILVNFAMQLKSAMEFTIGLMFLGLAKFDSTHWGIMLNYALYQAGALYTPKAFHYPFFIILNIILLIYGGIIFAQGLEEIFNPKLRGHE